GVGGLVGGALARTGADECRESKSCELKGDRSGLGRPAEARLPANRSLRARQHDVLQNLRPRHRIERVELGPDLALGLLDLLVALSEFHARIETSTGDRRHQSETPHEAGAKKQSASERDHAADADHPRSNLIFLGLAGVNLLGHGTTLTLPEEVRDHA